MERLFNTLEFLYFIGRDVAMWLSPLKHFQNESPGYTPERFEDVFKKIHITKKIVFPMHWIVRCRFGQETRETQVFLLHPFDPKKPSVTFHHGAGQVDHILPAKTILGKDILNSWNVFVIKAQKHASSYEYLSEAVDSFFHQQQTFAGSVLATEEIVQYHKKHSRKPIIVSGSSMGGIVATLHALLFGTGDAYVPIVAYPNVGEIFLGRAYRSGVAGWEEKRKNRAYLESYEMNISLKRSLRSRVIPVLGRFDRIVTFHKAEAFWKKQRITPIVFPYGHFTSVIKRGEIQKRILHLGGK
jgi:hypothetical protein